MKGRAQTRSLIAVLAAVAASLTGPAGTASEPAEERIEWKEAVSWSGMLTGGGGIVPQNLRDHAACPQGACDDFFLDVRVRPSPDPKRVRYVDVVIDDIRGENPGNLRLLIFPPGADLSSWMEYIHFDRGPKMARLIDPVQGVWRVRVVCFPAQGCGAPTTYAGSARTGALSVPRAVAHRAGAAGTTVGAAHIPTTRLRPVGTNGWEPTLGITGEGTIFYQGLVPNVMRSDDGGETWSDVSPRVGPTKRHRITLDPFLHVDEDTGRVFTVDMVAPFLCDQLSFTADGGSDWTTTAICEHAPDHQHVFTGPPALSPTAGYPNVVYWCVNGNGFMTAACSKSLDGGLTFAPTGTPAFTNPWPVEESGRCTAGVVGHGVVGADGTVYLPRGHCGQPFLAISYDEGLTWTQVQVADNGMPIGSPLISDLPGEGVGEHETGVAIDDAGNLYYAWMGYDRLPYLATSGDGGLTWSEPMMIGPPRVNEAALPAIAVGAPGKVAVAYMGTENSPGGPPFPGEGEGAIDDRTRPGYEGVAWNGYITMTATALAPDPVFLSAPVNDPRDPLVVGACGPTRCPLGGDFFDVAIAPDGTPWAAFVDSCVELRCQSLSGDAVAAQLVGGPSLR